jgi:hypothetical protein
MTKKKTTFTQALNAANSVEVGVSSPLPPTPNTSLPPSYEMDRDPLGTYRWNFSINGVYPKQSPGTSYDECRQAAWDHWTKTNNNASRACPVPIGTT